MCVREKEKTLQSISPPFPSLSLLAPQKRGKKSFDLCFPFPGWEGEGEGRKRQRPLIRFHSLRKRRRGREEGSLAQRPANTLSPSPNKRQATKHLKDKSGLEPRKM